MTKAALYARVSGDDRNNATSSIAAQLKDGRAYAKERGYEVVGEFAEDADRHTSGADMLPELEKLLRLAAQNFFDVLIVNSAEIGLEIIKKQPKNLQAIVLMKEAISIDTENILTLGYQNMYSDTNIIILKNSGNSAK